MFIGLFGPANGMPPVPMTATCLHTSSADDGEFMPESFWTFAQITLAHK